MAKDKFKQMQKGGGSFQESLVQAAATVAAIERQEEQAARQQSQQNVMQLPDKAATVPVGSPTGINPQEPPRFMRLPNPQIPLQEYNLVSSYCAQFANMTRQDFVELAIIEKLHSDGGMSQEDFNRRYEEIRNRPPRGQRKGTKNQPSK